MGIGAAPSPSHCSQCGQKLNSGGRFCNNCGAPLTRETSTVNPTRATPPVKSNRDVERHLKVAWSSLKDVENKADEVRRAKDAGDREVNEGTFRGTMAMTALQGRLEREFQESLDIAWSSAKKAQEIDQNASVEIDGSEVTPNIVFGGVCSLRGDLKFALEKWDEAVAFYKDALKHVPEEPGCYFNIGAAYTNKHDPPLAIEAFQKVVELDPTGQFGIDAAKNLEKLQRGVIGRKGFTGSWKVVAVLGGLAVLSLFMIGQQPGAGLMNFILWGGILTLYVRRKIK